MAETSLPGCQLGGSGKRARAGPASLHFYCSLCGGQGRQEMTTWGRKLGQDRAELATGGGEVLLQNT